MNANGLRLIVSAICLLCFARDSHPAESATKAEQASGGSAPRYKLTVGQELVYEGSSRFDYSGSSHRTTDRTAYWVTANNTDGSWHIVAQNESTFAVARGEGRETGGGQKRQSFDCFDLFPDGRIANLPQDPQMASLTAIVAKLPADLDAGRSGWEAPEQTGGKTLYKFDPANAPASGKWVFEKTEKGLFNEIYLSTNQSRVFFDGTRGLITKIESKTSQGYGINGRGDGLIELKSDSKKSADWTAQFARESDLFTKAKAAVQALYTSSKDSTNSEQAVARVEKALTDARRQVKLPIVETQFADALARLKDSAKYIAEDKLQEEQVLNKPAAPWLIVDLDGKFHKLADYQGKVVILDFWYRGCGWCIRAMPQLKELTDDFKNKPVAILGMNTDREIKDAHFVVDKLQLNYLNLRAEGIPELYHVQGFPTLILIDQKGIVRGRHVGYSPTLREDIAKQVNALLASGS
jgi:thiol-disulfide isomerase/thioredoxin